MASDIQSAPDSPSGSLVRVFVVAPIVSLSFAVGAFVALVSFVPRRAEGIRSVPDIEWSTYALIGNFLPIFMSIIALSYLFHCGRQRVVAWVLSVFCCYTVHEIFLADLLQRDFIGKL
jgi:hypothetical protein